MIHPDIEFVENCAGGRASSRAFRFFNKVYQTVKNVDEEIAEFFEKLLDNVLETSKFKSGLMDVYDFHSGQFGYTKDHKIKMLDY